MRKNRICVRSEFHVEILRDYPFPADFFLFFVLCLLLLVMESPRVSLIVRADGEIHKRYVEHSGGYLYVIGNLKSKKKESTVYFNLYCRDVLFVSEKKGKGSSGGSKKRLLIFSGSFLFFFFFGYLFGCLLVCCIFERAKNLLYFVILR